MSNLEPDSEPVWCPAGGVCPNRQTFPLRSSLLGVGLQIARALPHRQRRLVGPWCFLDRIGPVESTGPRMMNVAPHPHIGLQTVTWLFSGEIRHLDTLGVEQVIRPGQLNLMTAGKGVAHSEESLSRAGESLHGVQLWVALPDGQRHCEPDFEHHAELPSRQFGDVVVRVFAGELAGMRSPAQFWSPIVGGELLAQRNASIKLPVNPAHEHALLLIEGMARDPGGPLSADELLVIGPGIDELPLQLTAGTRVILIGGEPLDEDIVIWWNFVARSREEIVQARSEWQNGVFGRVEGYEGEPLQAPEMEGRLRGGR